tara:strand:+ start:1180 stop:1929 length:750 start_codon:yes stop_codon:yes gene_type:complete
MPLSKINRPGLNTGIADSSDATAITINSSEQVGIGATSVDQLLHLETNTNTRQKIETTNSGSVAGLQLTNTAITAEIGLETSNDAGGGAYSNSIGGSSLHILNNNNSGIVMDTSGRVTMPNQPSFCAYQTASHTTTNGQIYNFTALQTNVGNSFSLSGDRFTAPIGGTYYFSFYQLTGNDASSGDIRFLKNGAAIEAAYGYGVVNHTGHKQATLNIVITLAANDYCQIMSIGTNVWNDRHGNFSGFLIG